MRRGRCSAPGTHRAAPRIPSRPAVTKGPSIPTPCRGSACSSTARRPMPGRCRAALGATGRFCHRAAAGTSAAPPEGCQRAQSTAPLQLSAQARASSGAGRPLASSRSWRTAHSTGSFLARTCHTTASCCLASRNRGSAGPSHSFDQSTATRTRTRRARSCNAPYRRTRRCTRVWHRQTRLCAGAAAQPPAPLPLPCPVCRRP
mmetsp:Transcript_32116/g.95930  ORF Transcript_32116/g.95930 Transcript_32116/m.95930 type:complete len:203 (+) Transcript_32116:1798-2406(+)